MNSQASDPSSNRIPNPPRTRAIRWDQVQQGELTRRMNAVLLRWIRYADQQFAEWPERPNCGHFFGGSYWYGLETSYTAMIYAVAGKLGEYDAALTGLPRETVIRRAIQALRYLAFTHDSGPEECVRTEGRNPFCSKQKWGGRGENFFRASQTGTTVNAIGHAAWLLWDELDPETRQLVENVLVYYADRWSFEEEPRNGVYANTQCEENAWTSSGLYAAVALFPDHPRHRQWQEAAERWAINSVTTVKDQLLRAPDVTVTTFHPDFTAENHAFVHPSYMFAGIALRGNSALYYKMAGEPVPEQLTLNNLPMYEQTIKRWSLLDGYPIPIQGQDWWYNRQHEALVGHAMMNVLHGDADAALLERRTLEYVERIQASNTRGCMLEENGEECIVVASSYQTAVDMEFASAHSVAIAFMLHVFGGPGAEPAEPESFERRMSGVHLYPYGSFITHRTADTFSSFSWRSHVMALTLPKKAMWSVTPLYASYTGEVEFVGRPPGRAHNESFVLDTLQERIQDQADGFGATAELRRGAGGEVLQRIGFVSLPDGRSVYVEHVGITQPCEIARLSTGVIGIRNERYAELPDEAAGIKTIHTPTGSKQYEGFYGRSPNVYEALESNTWVNVNDEIGYVTFGSAGMAYLNQHEYPKWKGVEDVLTLNERTGLRCEAPMELPAFAVLTLPNRTARQTADAAAETHLLSADHDRLFVLETDGNLVIVHHGRSPARFTATGSWQRAGDGAAVVKLYEGRQLLAARQVRRFGRVEPGEARYSVSRVELRLPAEAAAALSEAPGALEAIVADETVVLRNDSRVPFTLTLRNLSDGSIVNVQLAPGTAQSLCASGLS
ncbi:hypothetical protein [Paenibacillus sp. HJGM_3]|uniref:hypothetical protein n=1 Tax=Paenibacillus sp. HJGM_3 TaxID=3379816 RepID=UPI00385A85B7